MLEWKDKIDGVDIILAEDINSIANAAIQTQNELAEKPDAENVYAKQNLVSIEEGKIDIGGGNPFSSTIIEDGYMRVGALGDADYVPSVTIADGFVTMNPGDESGRSAKMSYDDVTLVTPEKTHSLSEKADVKDVEDGLSQKQPTDFLFDVNVSLDEDGTQVVSDASKTCEEVLEAYYEGKRLAALWNGFVYCPLYHTNSVGMLRFLYHSQDKNEKDKLLTVSLNGWVITEIDKMTDAEIAEKIAAEVAPKADKEEWRLINELELTEDAVVEFTADADGNAFNLKKLKLIVSMPQLTTTSQVWLKTNNVLAVYTDNIPANTGTPAVSITGELTYAWQFETCYSRSGRGNSGSVTTFPSGSRYAGPITGTVGKIMVGLNSGMTTPLPAGSTITLWGCE